MRKEITTKKAPQAIGPYSQAIKVGKLIFCAGQIGADPETNIIVDGGIREQTKTALDNLSAVLSSSGASLQDVVKTTVYLSNMEDFPVMNEVYATYFAKPYPARATVQVVKLPKNALIEIDCIAIIAP